MQLQNRYKIKDQLQKSTSIKSQRGAAIISEEEGTRNELSEEMQTMFVTEKEKIEEEKEKEERVFKTNSFITNII